MKPQASRSAPRLFVPVELPPGAEIRLPDRAVRHIAALRLQRGESIILFNGQGGEFTAELTRVGGGDPFARVVSGRSVERESALAIALAQCVSSGDRMDTTLQKSTELGVAKIVPITSERSVVRLSGERAEKRVAHWRNVVVAACEQCGRNRVPEVSAIASFSDFIDSTLGNGLRLLLSPDASHTLKDLGPAAEVTLLIGPEGGLAPHEKRRAESAGFVPVRFGPRVLRTETAPLAVIAALQALWGDC
jgi:16S rRNA (uracil1498-N3)-methyltransferase